MRKNLTWLALALALAACAPTTAHTAYTTVTVTAPPVTVTIAAAAPTTTEVPTPSPEPVASQTYTVTDKVFAVGHPRPGLDEVLPVGLYRAVPTAESSMVQRCSTPVCGGGQTEGQIDATVGVTGGSVVNMSSDTVSVWVFNMTLTGPL